MADKTDVQQPQGRFSLKLIVWALAFVMVMGIFPESVTLILIGMVPTLVAYIVDKSEGKYATICVGGMNFTGVFPALSELWEGKLSFPAVFDITFDPINLTIMFAAAGLGWTLYALVPPVIAAGLAVAAQHRIRKLRSDQRALIQEWGPAIAAIYAPTEEGGDNLTTPE